MLISKLRPCGARYKLAACLLVLLFGLISLAGDSSARANETENTPTSDADKTPDQGDEPKKALTAKDVQGNMNAMWTVLAAVLVFFMQAGFAMVESGFTRAKNACNIMMKNLMDFSIGSLAFWIVGFGLMFGASSATAGWLGIDNFLFDAAKHTSKAGNTESFGWAFLIFQTVFCATAATIVSGAMAERTKFHGYLLYSIAITAIVYPVFGGWAWGGLWGDKGWLELKGFTDFAGSTVVHSIGGWCALAGAIVLGPRIGKYKDGKSMPIPGHSIPLAALGVFILWFGWFGFNAGSTTSINVDGGIFAKICVTTNLAAASGAIGALAVSWWMFKKPDTSFALNGALAGLVSITAGCASMDPALAALTGLIGGLIVVPSVMLFDRAKIDDPVGAISVHGVCGAWGTLAVGIYGGGNFLIQLLGVVTAFAWAFPVSFGFFYLIKVTIGLRASAEEELAGLDISEHGMHAYPLIFVADDTISGTSVTPSSQAPSSPTTAATPAANSTTEGA